jgi:tRNA nucleotidyltransferase (CCA-adding enzyme)
MITSKAGVRGKGPTRPAMEMPTAVFKRALPGPTHRALRLIGRIADRAGYGAYLVGGIVRDIALGYPDTDLDVMIEGRADEVARRFAREFGGTFKKRTEFGTCKVETEALGTIDFAEARTETYRHPGALPEVEQSDIDRDLWRRDFTINAMALCLNPGRYGTLRDPCGGLADLRHGRLRVMHRESFTDDPTRVLRGIRFAVRHGFEFDRGTGALARACIEGGGLGTISGKRIYREIRLICAEPAAASGLRMLARRGVLGEVLGAGWSAKQCDGIWRGLGAALTATGAISEVAVRQWVCWFASLFTGLSRDRAQQVSDHLNLPRDVRDVCLWVATNLAPASALLRRSGLGNAYRVRRALDLVPWEGLVVLWAASPIEARRVLAEYLIRWSKIAPCLSGGEIATLGCGEGPQVGEMREAILRLKLGGKLATREEEIAFVKRRVAALARGSGAKRC